VSGKSRKTSRRRPARPDDAGPFVFKLYVAGESPNSLLALFNLRALCARHLPERHAIHVIDVFQQPKRALADRILVTPTLIKTSPAPARRIIGNLSEETEVLLALGLQAKDDARKG
jgi:circadian clock protein KaiB